MKEKNKVILDPEEREKRINEIIREIPNLVVSETEEGKEELHKRNIELLNLYSQRIECDQCLHAFFCLHAYLFKLLGFTSVRQGEMCGWSKSKSATLIKEGKDSFEAFWRVTQMIRSLLVDLEEE